jgi:hypothetical protein
MITRQKMAICNMSCGFDIERHFYKCSANFYISWLLAEQSLMRGSLCAAVSFHLKLFHTHANTDLAISQYNSAKPVGPKVYEQIVRGV